MSAGQGYILPAPTSPEATRAVEALKQGEPMHCGCPARRPGDRSKVTLVQVGSVGTWLRIHQTVGVSRTTAADLAAANGQQLESRISNEAASRPFNPLNTTLNPLNTTLNASRVTSPPATMLLLTSGMTTSGWLDLCKVGWTPTSHRFCPPDSGSARAWEAPTVAPPNGFLPCQYRVLRRSNVLFFVEHGTRRVHLADFIAQPTGKWVAQ